MDIFYLGRKERKHLQWCEGVGLTIEVDSSLKAFQTPPAVYSYYLMSDGSKVLGSHCKTELLVHRKKHGTFGTVNRVVANIILTFEAGKQEPIKLPDIPVSMPWLVDEDVSLDEAAQDLETKMYAAAMDYGQHLDNKRVAVMLSGGSDSVGNLVALVDAGYTPHAYTVTVEDDGFDAIEATKIAEQLGVKHTVLKFPKDPNKVFALMKRAVMTTGATDYANVMMGTLTEFALTHIREKVVFHGHFGDSFWGNRGTLFGAFKRDYAEYQTAYEWNLWRWLTQSVGSTPQNAQIDSLHTQHGKTWRALYAHPLVQANIFGHGLHVTPIKKGKKHLRHWLNNRVKDGSWLTEGKNQYGYPEGAGINKLKETCPFTQGELRDVVPSNY